MAISSFSASWTARRSVRSGLETTSDVGMQLSVHAGPVGDAGNRSG